MLQYPSMEEEWFEKLVTEALDSLPSEFSEKLKNVAVIVEDYPTVYQLQKLRLRPSTLLFGLYEGVPQTKRGNYSAVLPDKITIFKNAILRISRNEEETRAQVRATVIHEIGHHFGLSDKELK